MKSFPNFEPVCRSMSGSYWYFPTIQVSQEAGNVVWYSHLFKNFPHFVVIHTVKGFSVAYEAEVDISLEFSCFSYDPTDVSMWCLAPLPFLNTAWASGSSSSTYCWNVSWELTFAGVWNECDCAVVWTFFGIALLWDWNDNWLFPGLSFPNLSFPSLLPYWVQHFNTIIF